MSISQSLFPIVCLLLYPVIFTGCEKEMKTYSNDSLGIEFKYPDRFQIGSYAKVELAIEMPFNNAVVLVESKQLQDFQLNSIPVGEVPTISLNIPSGSRASAMEELFFKTDFKTQIGGFTVYKLPGIPGPYGDQAFYYLVSLPDHKVLEVMAHRYYFREKGSASQGGHPRTNYDKDIEELIRTLKVTKR